MTSARTPRSADRHRHKCGGRLSYWLAPRPPRSPTSDPSTMKLENSRFSRGTQRAQTKQPQLAPNDEFTFLERARSLLVAGQSHAAHNLIIDWIDGGGELKLDLLELLNQNEVSVTPQLWSDVLDTSLADLIFDSSQLSAACRCMRRHPDANLAVYLIKILIRLCKLPQSEKVLFLALYYLSGSKRLEEIG